ncbi:MAG: carboxypeptidase-like regulatory domain-containing protein, partial [Bacteroidales bacterium]|nr:carboxypeptidase-like regulatory domain-containing protein [Bacteroidales bacterium]
MNLFFVIDYKLLTKVCIALLCMFLPLISNAQNGSIKGFVKEKDSGESIPVANVVIVGTNTGTITDFDGNFELSNLREGYYDIQVSFISYKTETINGIKVTEKQNTEIVVELESESQMLKEVEISAEVKKDNENLLLMERQNSTQIVQQIGAQELERKGASDVASALAKVSGISKTEQNNDVYVRGLGDRYNSTTLNQLPIPSNNPEQKNVSLDIFSTGIVE